MSKSVEDKVVKMSLENRGFLSKIKESISSMNILDRNMSKAKNLNFNAAQQSLGRLSNQARGTNLNALTNGVETVKARFSAMGAIAIGALMRIGSTAVDAGGRLIRAFTLDPIIGGFQMYESKLKAIQVILANTQGKSTYSDVTQSLKELNDYANKTVYSFQDMTTNMGTFTAAGVDLKTAQIAIQGIGNLAASSGSSTQQAAMAMYQLSQALASGKVGLQDWNSVVNAGMGGKKFQTALQQTAKEMGKNIDKSKSFRDSLKDGWLTSDVLTKTLEKFANNESMLKAATQAKTFSDVMDAVDDELKSGWSNTWEMLIGDFKEAPKLWSGVSKVITGFIQDQANARNELVKGFVVLGGRMDTIKAFGNIFHSLGQIIHSVSQAFHDIFPPVTAHQLATMAAQFRELTEKMRLSQDTMDKLRSVFRGVFAVFDIGIQVIKRVAAAFIHLIPSGLGDGILDIAARVGDMITSFDKALHKGDSLTDSFKGLHLTIKPLSEAFSKLKTITSNVFGALSNSAKSMGDALVPIFESAGGEVKKFAKLLTFDNILKGGLLISLVKITGSFKKVAGSIDEVIGDIGKSFKNLNGKFKGLEEMKDALKAVTTGINIGSLVALAAATTALALSMKLLSGLPAVDIAKGLEVLGVALFGITRTLKAVSAMGMGIKSSFAAVAVIKALAKAVLILSASLKIISTIDGARMAQSLLTMAGMIGELVLALLALSKIQGATLISSVSLISLSSALLVLSAAVAALAAIPTQGVIQGLISIGLLLGEVALFSKAMASNPISMRGAIAMNLISSSMVIISAAVLALGALPFPKLLSGLAGIAGLLTEIALFSHAIKSTGMMKAALAMVPLAAAIAILAPPVVLLGSIPLENLAQGLMGMAVALGEVVLALTFAQAGLAGAAAILTTAAAIAVLVPPLIALSAIPIKALGAALLALAGAFTIIGVAGLAATAVAPGLLVLSVAVGALGLAMTGAALLVGAFAAAFALFAGATTSGVNNAVQSFNSLLKGLNTSVPLIIQLAEKCMLGMIDAIARSAPRIANAGLNLILGLLKAIDSHIFEIAKVGVDIVVRFAAALTDGMPRLVNAGLNLIISTINSMANAVRDHGDDIIQAVQNLIEAILELLITAFQKVIDTTLGWIPGVKGATKHMGKGAKKALRDAFQVKDVGKKGGKDFVDGVNSKKGDANRSGKNLAKNAKDGSKTNLKPNGSKGGKDFVDGINRHKGGAHGAGSNLKKSAKSGSTISLFGNGSHGGSTFNSGVNKHRNGAHSAGHNLGKNARRGANVSLHQTGHDVGQGFVNGLGSGGLLHGVWSAAWSLGKQAIAAVKAATDSHSPSREAIKVGKFVSQGFSIGIDRDSEKAASSGQSLGKTAMSSLMKTAQMIQDVMDDNLDYQPVITPVLDDSQLKRSALGDFGMPHSMLGSAVFNAQSDQGSQPQLNVKMDLKPLEDKIDKLENQQPVNLNLTVYGNLDDVTARKWAGPIAEALEKVRRRQGGSYY